MEGTVRSARLLTCTLMRGKTGASWSGKLQLAFGNFRARLDRSNWSPALQTGRSPYQCRFDNPLQVGIFNALGVYAASPTQTTLSVDNFCCFAGSI